MTSNLIHLFVDIDFSSFDFRDVGPMDIIEWFHQDQAL